MWDGARKGVRAEWHCRLFDKDLRHFLGEQFGSRFCSGFHE